MPSPLKTKSRQEVFDETVTFLLKQNACAIGETGICRLRDQHGRKCALGYWIPDDEFQPWMDSYSLGSLLEVLHWRDDYKFWQHLQAMHDNCADCVGIFRADVSFRERLLSSAKRVADHFGLTFDESKFA